MSLLFLVLALLLSGIWFLGHILVSRQRWKSVAVIVAALLAGAGLAFRPVCVPIAEADLAAFNPPIEQRAGANFYGLRFFQQIDDDWYHCKTWLARQVFF